jgi:hypothetical protein
LVIGYWLLVIGYLIAITRMRRAGIDRIGTSGWKDYGEYNRSTLKRQRICSCRAPCCLSCRIPRQLNRAAPDRARAVFSDHPAPVAGKASTIPADLLQGDFRVEYQPQAHPASRGAGREISHSAWPTR